MDFLVTEWSYLGIILFLILTGCGLPIPEEVPIILAGAISAQHPETLQPFLAFIACIFGALVGDSIMYAIGYHWGHGLLSAHPRIGKFLHAEREEKFELALERHGMKVMLLARFLVGIRGPVYLAAGVVRIPFRRFILTDLVAATLVVSLFYWLAFFFGQRIYTFIHEAEIWLTVIVVIALACVGIFFWRRGRKMASALTSNTETTNNEES